MRGTRPQMAVGIVQGLATLGKRLKGSSKIAGAGNRPRAYLLTITSYLAQPLGFVLPDSIVQVEPSCLRLTGTHNSMFLIIGKQGPDRACPLVRQSHRGDIDMALLGQSHRTDRL